MTPRCAAAGPLESRAARQEHPRPSKRGRHARAHSPLKGPAPLSSGGSRLQGKEAIEELDRKLASLKSAMDRWDLDPYELEVAQLGDMFKAMLHSLGLVRRFSIPVAALNNFWQKVVESYNDVPFHSVPRRAPPAGSPLPAVEATFSGLAAASLTPVLRGPAPARARRPPRVERLPQGLALPRAERPQVPPAPRALPPTSRAPSSPLTRPGRRCRPFRADAGRTSSRTWRSSPSCSARSATTSATLGRTTRSRRAGLPRLPRARSQKTPLCAPQARPGERV